MRLRPGSGLALFARLLRQARPCWPHIVGLLLIGLLSTPLALLRPVPTNLVADCVLGRHTDGEHGWLFVEDAGDERLGLQAPDGRRTLTRWLATLHAGASQVPAIASLPERSAAHSLQHLHTARTMMRGNRDNPALQNADREVLDVILGQLDIVEAHWGEIESACATMPRTLVHGDVTGKNLRLRRRGRSQTLVTFDWEMAGSGVPAPDLVLVQAGLYASLVRDTWPDLDAPCIRQMGRIGKLFRGALAPISWASLSLQYAWVEHPMILLRLYEERLRESLRAAGWERTHDDDASPRIMADGSSRSCRDNGRAGACACRARSIAL